MSTRRVQASRRLVLYLVITTATTTDYWTLHAAQHVSLHWGGPNWVFVRSGLHWTSQTCWQCSWELPVAPFLWGMSACNSPIPSSEVCLHVVVPGGLSVLKFCVMLFPFSFTIYCLSSGNNSHSSIFSMNLRSKAVGFFMCSLSFSQTVLTHLWFLKQALVSPSPGFHFSQETAH